MSTTPPIKYSGPVISPAKEDRRERDRAYHLANREKRNARKVQWRRENAEKQREKRKLLYWSDPEAARAKARQWREKDPERARISGRESRARLKSEVMQAYGEGHCACCGETQLEFLTLDHVNNDGGKRRKSGEELWATPFYQKLKRDRFPPRPDLQVLCYNCNCAKKSTGKCPHEIHVTAFLRRSLA